MKDANHKPTTEPAPEDPKDAARRSFFRRLSIVLGGGTAVGLAMPMAGFVLAPLARKTPEVWRTVGKVDDFKVGETVDVRFEDASPLPWAGVTARTAAWLRREQDSFIAFSIHCTHLGCPVRWLKSAGLFMCPCHGGVFYANGDVAAGPPPRPLTRYAVRVVDNLVQIQTAPLSIFTRE